VVAGAFWLAKTGRQIAEITGWGETFVGALFLALVTSLPEVAVCVAAVRLGSPELGLGNILGSNIFNLAVVFPTDLAYPGGSIMEKGNASTGVAAGMGILLTLVLAAAIKFKAARPRRWGWETISIILIYLGGMYLLFHLS
jgi:cation:H+ antiporter